MDRFREQLRRQLGYIERSCEDYDLGKLDEAVRIGTTLRVLLHQTNNQTSLLTHLGVPQIPLLSTCRPVSLPGTLMYDGITKMTLNGRAEQSPKLGRSSYKGFLTAPDWFTQVVIIKDALQVTRKQIILVAADRDGGAHVDTKLSPEYEALIEGMRQRISPDPARQGPMGGVHFLALRQFGYELLNSPELIKLTTA